MPSLTVKITAIRIADAIPLFEQHLEAEDSAENTRKRYSGDMKRLRKHAGNVYVHMVTPEHIDRILAEHQAKGNSPGTRNSTISNLRIFFKWARANKYTVDDPMEGRELKRYKPAQPPHIEPEKWGTILDLAEKRSPLHRAYFALGLYLMARGPSEIGELRLWDLTQGAHGWTAAVTRKKTRDVADPFQMSNELCIEMARWLTWYNNWTIEHLGAPLQPSWFVIPATRAGIAKGATAGSRKRDQILIPDKRRHSGNFSNLTRPILEEFGHPVADPITGKKNGWGGTHTLRKSGARAWFNELCITEGSRDKALRIVQAALGHANVAQTEHYLGLDADREFRNEALRGKWMFRINDPEVQASEGVTQLRPEPPITPEVEQVLEGLPGWLRAV